MKPYYAGQKTGNSSFAYPFFCFFLLNIKSEKGDVME